MNTTPTYAQAKRIIDRADVVPTDPITTITDELYDWALVNMADEDLAAEWSMNMAADIVGREG